MAASSLLAHAHGEKSLLDRLLSLFTDVRAGEGLSAFFRENPLT